MNKQETAEEIYKRALESIRDYCMNRNFHIYTNQILKETEYYLKKGQQVSNKVQIPSSGIHIQEKDKLSG